MDKNYEAMKDLRFTFTEEMHKEVIRMLVIKQLLDEEELTTKQRKQLEKEKDKIFKHFVKEFQAHNVTQVAIYRAFMSGKKNERDEN